MTGPIIDLERLKAIVEDPNKAKALPPTLVAHIRMDLAARDATNVKPSAGVEMLQTGITPNQKHDTGLLGKALYNLIDPSQGYYDQGEKLKKAIYSGELIKEIASPSAEPHRHSTDPRIDLPNNTRDQPTANAAWSLYLGIPQQTKSFEVSPFKPTKAKDQTGEYLRIKDFLPRMIQLYARSSGDPPSEQLKRLIDEIDERKKFNHGGGLQTSDDIIGQFTLGRFTIDRGHDEVGPYLSYHDRWDLDQAYGADKFGKPFEVYDRMYYDPKTFVPISEADILAKKVKLDLKSPENQALIKKWHSEINKDVTVSRSNLMR